MTTKIAVSLPDEQVAAARAAVAAKKYPSVSAFVAEAIAARERAEALQEVLDLLGPPTPESDAWAKAVVESL